MSTISEIQQDESSLGPDSIAPAGAASGDGGDDARNRQKADLVLEGGGVKGIALAGAVLELAQDYQFQRVAGTSAGAVAATLIAALNRAGEPIGRLADILKTLDYSKFIAKGWLRRTLGPLGDGEHLLFHLGLYDGDYLLEWLGGVLADLRVTTFGDLRLDDANADASWRAAQRFSLVVHASDITRGKLVRLPWDYPAYGLDPAQQKLTNAVRASMSIPFFFEPVRLRCTATAEYAAGNVTWVDGGLLDNYPVDVFDRTDDAPSRWPTIGIKLSGGPTAHAAPADCDDVLGEAVACLRTALNNADRTYVPPDKAQRTIFVDTDGIASTDFSLTPDQQTTLFNNGRSAAQAWLTQAPRA